MSATSGMPLAIARIDTVFNPPAFDRRVSDLLGGYPPEIFTEKLHFSIELIQRYTLELAAELLQSLGVTAHMRSWRTADELCRVLSFDSKFTLTLGWLIDAAVELGDIEVRQGESLRYRMAANWRPRDVTLLRERVLAIDAANAATLDLLDYAASIYPAVARGEASAEQVLFDPQKIALWLAYFRNDNPTYAVNNWIGALAAIDRVANRSKFSILEIGAGAASGAEILLEVLNARGLAGHLERYVVTEPSAFFLHRAQRHLTRRHPYLPLEFRALDINRPWRAQSASEAGFDLVYGINVMHVAHDLAYSLRQARDALASNGWLVMGECVHTNRYKPIFPEFIFQMLDSFRSVQTDPALRPAPGFLTPHYWRCALAHAGFHVQQVEPDVERISALCPNFLSSAVCGQKQGPGFEGSAMNRCWTGYD
jgi:SAM-dependent methyltransferase